MVNLPVLNLAEARFECTFGKGCDGVCCRNGRPLIYPKDAEKIDRKLDCALPLLRETARIEVLRSGYVSRRKKRGNPMARVVDGWCVFFNRGCILHRLGADEGDVFKYKPAVCALFPLDRDYDDRWYVRQKDYNGEIWDLHCLDPARTGVRATDSLRNELALASSIS